MAAFYKNIRWGGGRGNLLNLPSTLEVVEYCSSTSDAHRKKADGKIEDQAKKRFITQKICI